MRPPKPLQDRQTRRHQNSSQAECAGSIPVTRSARERHCSTIELEVPVLYESGYSIHARATWATDPTSALALPFQNDAQLVPSCARVSGSFNRRGIFGGSLHADRWPGWLRPGMRAGSRVIGARTISATHLRSRGGGQPLFGRLSGSC